ALFARRSRSASDGGRGASSGRAHGRSRRRRRHHRQRGRQGRWLRPGGHGRNPHRSARARMISSARFDELRAMHPRFTYEDYAIERVGDDLRLTFSFTMAPDLVFAPTTTLRGVDTSRLASLPREALDVLTFHLGLIELLSYWKTACAPEILIKAGALDAEQVAWWTDLILHGMREFFFVNAIDFRRPDLFVLVAGPRAGRSTARYEGT